MSAKNTTNISKNNRIRASLFNLGIVKMQIISKSMEEIPLKLIHPKV